MALESTFGVLALTSFVSSFLTGVTTMQAYIYIKNYGKDPLRIKLYVAIVWLLSMAHSGLQIYATWHYVIQVHDNPLLLLKVHYSAVIALAVSTTQIFVAQLFLARRVHVFLGTFLSKWRASLWFALFLVCILGNLAGSFSGIGVVFTLKSVMEMMKMKDYLLVTLAFNIAVDTLITAVLGWSLLNSKSGQKQSDRVVRWIALCSINTGLLPCLSAMAGLIFFVHSPNTFWFLFCINLISDTYANCILANLNSRSFFKEKMMSPQRTPISYGSGQSRSVRPSMMFQVTTTDRTMTTGEDMEMSVVSTKSRVEDIEEIPDLDFETSTLGIGKSMRNVA
ncbi:hypothetical protein PM082_001388 [Marasmius tenuissimus]|nr:hypothetical protein PM082_001388 [Marasmius tenuissimus]